MGEATILKWAVALASLGLAYLFFLNANATPLPNFIDYIIAIVFAVFGIMIIYHEMK